MADKEKDKAKAKGGDKDKPAKKPDTTPKAQKADKPDKAAKAEQAAEAAVAEADAKKAAKAAPRPPADPRAKVWKKFRGRYLPRGPLRDRLVALEARWNSNDDHGGVTVDELKSLLNDWRASRKKRATSTV